MDEELGPETGGTKGKEKHGQGAEAWRQDPMSAVAAGLELVVAIAVHQEELVMHFQSPNAPSNISQVAQVLYVAIELSKSAWVVATQNHGKSRPSLHKLAAGDVDGLLAVAAKAQAQQGANSVTCCYEIGYDGFWLARRLTALGWEVRIVEPASLQVDRRARRAKTDRIV